MLTQQMRLCAEQFRTKLKTITNHEVREFRNADSIVHRFDRHWPRHTMNLLRWIYSDWASRQMKWSAFQTVTTRARLWRGTPRIRRETKLRLRRISKWKWLRSCSADCYQPLPQGCEKNLKFLRDSNKQWVFVAMDGGPMISLLKLQLESS